MGNPNTLHLTEGLWITARAPDRVPLKPLPGGGGGPGFGGWGLDAGRPRGTGGPSRFVRDPGWRSVFGEEQHSVDATHAELYASELKQLGKQIETERAVIAQLAGSGSGPHHQRHQQLLTANLQERRSDYLKLVPLATSFYGAIPFYKRYDSFSSRLNDEGAFALSSSGEAWARNIWLTYNASVDAAYRLHITAATNQALTSELPELAYQVDRLELEQQSVDLPKAVERRTAQIQSELQIGFDCLPNFLQHEIVESAAVREAEAQSKTLEAYRGASIALMEAKRNIVPAFRKSNPNIRGPLSKPQVEALQHLVDEQRTRRAGPLWADYHRALSLTEQIRHLQVFSNTLANLLQRAIEAEQLQATQQSERNRIRYASGATAPAITPIGTTSFAIPDIAYTALRGSVRTAVKGAIERVVASTPSVLVGTLALLWPSSLGNSERRYLTSIPLTDLSPPDGPDLGGMAASAQALDLPYLLAGVEEADRLDLYIVPGGKSIPVREAVFDAERQVFSLALDNPQRILTWTPAIAPGSQDGSSTSLPTVSPGTVIYGGSSLDPVNNESQGYPDLDLLDQERLIVTFPIDSGLPPILVVFKSPRYEPGVATGLGATVEGIWLAEETRGTGAEIPSQVADAIRGKEFRDFDAFRGELWKVIANTPALSKQFNPTNNKLMSRGYAPKARIADHHKGHATFILHHVTPISQGGAVYDIENIRVVTPKAHNKIHYGTSQ
ncbi:S-type pyocin domain-containing protein [Pseudomonas farsensis]|uniref:S-type pyocin domain-containing protein n=1 Tax=Pseudomonas farsensis TaxID=2745492 RepID=A0ABU8QSR5_9PSED